MANIVDQLTALRRQHADDVAKVRDNRDLTPAAKRRQLQEIHDKAERTRRELLAQDEQDRAAAVRKSSENLFASPFGPLVDPAMALVASRDARDRARAIKSPGDMLDAMQSALAVNDESLSRELLRTAWSRAGDGPLEQRWNPVCDAYFAHHPERRQAGEALAEAERHGLAGLSPEARIVTGSLSAPSELRGSAPADDGSQAA